MTANTHIHKEKNISLGENSFLDTFACISLYDGQRKMFLDGVRAVNEGKIAALESPTGTGKTITALLIGMFYLQKSVILPGVSLENISLLQELYQIREKHMIYACRTHSQISQVIEEVNLLNKASGNSFTATALGSRKRTCINRKAALSVDINNCCKILVRDKKCPYYLNMIKKPIKTNDKHLKSISIEDAVSIGKEMNECPYYHLKKRASTKGIIVVPHSMIMKESFFREHRIREKDTLIVIDEAHNLCRGAAEENSVDISVDDLYETLICIKRYIDKASKIENKLAITRQQRVDTVETYIFIERIYNYALRRANEEKEADKKIDQLNEFLKESQIEDTNVLQLAEVIERSRIAEKVSPLNIEEIDNKVNKCIKQIEKLCTLIGESSKESYVQIEKNILSFRSIYLTGKLSHLEQADGLILIGGTLFPSNDLKSLFSLPVVQHTYPAVCTRVRVSISLTAMFTYSRRDFEIDTLIDRIKRYEEKVSKGGILVFLQSKEVIEIIRNKINVLNENEQLKSKWLFEGYNTLNEYTNRVSKDGKACMFCVMGGNFSEGINFSDSLCRLLIVCGIPLPKPTPATNIVMQHKGKEYFLDQGMLVVNQTIGRSVRGVKDYCYVILLDSRFNKYKDKLSKWLHPYISVPKSDIEIEQEISEYLDKWKK